MADRLSFEEKIEGLMGYYQALEAIDPRNPDHSEIANPDFFHFAQGYHASESLRMAREGVLNDMACHARVEYGHYHGRGFDIRNLHEDSEEMHLERADVLAVVTSPPTPEVRQERAERIADMLASVVAGETLRVTKYHGRADPQEPQMVAFEQVVAFDTTRALFAVFREGHISGRTMTFQYDSPLFLTHNPDAVIGKPVLNISLPSMFKQNGIVLERAAA
jgi:hypothetical protein